MNQETVPQSDEIFRHLWIDHAQSGIIWVPKTVSNEWSRLIRMRLYGLREQHRIEVLIDCRGGGDKSFEPCVELWWRRRHGKETETIVIGEAKSIGLSYAVCGTHRVAVPDAEFMAHGENVRAGALHESGIYLEDHYAADWLARFTKRTYEEWLAFLGDGEYHHFGVAEALEWGVIDEVLEGV